MDRRKKELEERKNIEETFCKYNLFLRQYPCCKIIVTDILTGTYAFCIRWKVVRTCVRKESE
jgi:hypothetical protein